MGLRVLATTPIAMTFMGLPVNGVLGRGVRNGDDSKIVGLMDWLHPDQFSSFIIDDMTAAKANNILARANRQDGVKLADADNSWLALVVSPAALQAAFIALGLPVNGALASPGAGASDTGDDPG